MSNEVSSATAFQPKSNKTGTIAKYVAPLVLGTAAAFGTTSATAAEPPPPTPIVHQITAQEAKTLSPVFAFHDTASGKFIFGYATGALAGHLLEGLRQRREKQDLYDEIDELNEKLSGQGKTETPKNDDSKKTT